MRGLVSLSWGNIGLDGGLVTFGRGLLVWTHRWLVTLGRVCIGVFLNRGLLIRLIGASRLPTIFLLIGTWLKTSGSFSSPWLIGRDRVS